MLSSSDRLMVEKFCFVGEKGKGCCLCSVCVEVFGCIVVVTSINNIKIEEKINDAYDHVDEDRRAYQSPWSKTVRPQQGSRYPSG